MGAKNYNHPVHTFFILLTTRDHMGQPTMNSKLGYDIFRSWCQGLFIPQVPCAYTAQLLTLHQLRANNQ